MFVYNSMLRKGFVNTVLSFSKYCYATKIIRSPIKEDTKLTFKKEY